MSNGTSPSPTYQPKPPDDGIPGHPFTGYPYNPYYGYGYGCRPSCSCCCCCNPCKSASHGSEYEAGYNAGRRFETLNSKLNFIILLIISSVVILGLVTALIVVLAT